jgi:hypothetical protein
VIRQVTSSRGNGPARRFGRLGGRAALPTTREAATALLLASACRSNGGSQSRAAGRGSGRLAEESLCIPFGGLEPTLVPGPRPPVITCSRTDSPTAVISNGVSSLGQRSREVFEVFLSSMWLAVFKMMHRSGGCQGCGQLLTAFAALTDRDRSRRTSPRPGGHPGRFAFPPEPLLSNTNSQERTQHEHRVTGRFTADPELKITSGQRKAVTTVRVAINEQGRDKTVFIDLQSWEKTAEFIASYGTKGRLFEATARLALDQWTDTEGGQHSKHYLVTGPYQFRFLDKSSGTDEPEAPAEDG